MSLLTPPLWPNDPSRAQTLARIARRQRPERRLLGLLAAAVRHEDTALIEAVQGEALGWPEDGAARSVRKAVLLFEMTALLARAGQMDLALRLAPCIPFAPGMAQVLVFSAGEPPQRFCWRVAPAYALVRGRRPAALPVAELARPYQRGEVIIDDAYLRRVLLPRRRRPPPILLLPHPLGQVRLGGGLYVILDGNHRVVSAWRQGRFWIPGFVLTAREGTAVLISHSQWPPYASVRLASTGEP
ncbi:MAG TPA: hypothetical protein VNL77_02760 [Roseiflexaceae bacterium]|nr:hypothetical protein [Roseiflexaceae bacterium]